MPTSKSEARTAIQVVRETRMTYDRISPLFRQQAGRPSAASAGAEKPTGPLSAWEFATAPMFDRPLSRSTDSMEVTNYPRVCTERLIRNDVSRLMESEPKRSPGEEPDDINSLG